MTGCLLELFAVAGCDEFVASKFSVVILIELIEMIIEAGKLALAQLSVFIAIELLKPMGSVVAFGRAWPIDHLLRRWVLLYPS